MQQLLSKYIRSQKQGNMQIVQPGPPVSVALTSQMPAMPQPQRNPEHTKTCDGKFTRELLCFADTCHLLVL